MKDEDLAKARKIMQTQYTSILEAEEENRMNSAIPLYLQLAETIRHKIASGEYDDAIPSEHELVGQYKMSRATVRQALMTLTHEGLLYAHHGKGTFVRREEEAINNEDMEKTRQTTQGQMAALGNSLFQKEPLHQNGRTLTTTTPPIRRLRLEDIELYTVGEDISIESLFQSRLSYKFPDFQREFVWSMKDQQLLIDSALRPQFDIDSIEVFEEMTDDGPLRWLIDGGQRFRTLIWFRENRFPTFSGEQFGRASRNSGFSIIEPKRLFSEMTVMGQNKFKARNIHLKVTRVHGNYTFEGVQPLIAERFRRAQHHRRLNVAEILYSYPSGAKEFAKGIADHTTWTEIYQQTKRTKRRQPYAIGLIVIALHLKASPMNLTTNELENVACGLYDAYLTPDLLESINLFLYRLHHVFYGVRATSTSDVIPLIQACQFLEQGGYDLERSERGCLTDWFYKARPVANSPQAWGKFSQMGQLGVQRQFWAIQRTRLFEQSGLVKSNRRGY